MKDSKIDTDVKSESVVAKADSVGEDKDFLSGVEAQEVDWEAQVCIGCD